MKIQIMNTIDNELEMILRLLFRRVCSLFPAPPQKFKIHSDMYGSTLVSMVVPAAHNSWWYSVLKWHGLYMVSSPINKVTVFNTSDILKTRHPEQRKSKGKTSHRKGGSRRPGLFLGVVELPRNGVTDW